MLSGDIKSEIASFLIRHPGSKAREIAYSLGLEKTVVNSVLYTNSFEFSVDDEYCWTYADSYPYMDKVLRKLNNTFSSKEFSEQEFLNLARWDEGVSHTGEGDGELFKFPNGDKVYTDSSYELKMLRYLKKKNLAIRYGGQALKINYSSAFKEDKSYFPDIIILTQRHRIAIIEIKPVTAMSNHTNMEKYKALAAYCIANGFEYMMVDPEKDYMTYEELAEMPVIPELIPYFEHKGNTPERYRYFDSKKVNKWYEKYGDGMKKTDFELEVHSLIVFYNWYNKFDKGFKVYSKPVINGRICKDLVASGEWH